MAADKTGWRTWKATAEQRAFQPGLFASLEDGINGVYSSGYG